MGNGTVRTALRAAATATAVLALAAAGVAAPALAQSAPTPQPPRQAPPKWGPFIDLGGKLGTKRNLGEGDLFVPLAQNGTTLLFADLRARLDDKSSNEGNFGLGLRRMLPSGWNLGAYGYFDRRRTALGSYFSQATFGAEALSPNWDLRANVYLPVGPRTKTLSDTSTFTTASTGTSSASLAGTAVQVTTTTTTTTTGTRLLAQEVEQHGFDAEIGWRVPFFAPDDTTQLRVYAGGYRFSGGGVEATQGPRGRIDLTVDQVPHLWQGARLDLGTEVQHDRPRGTQAFVLLSLRIPLEIFPSARPSQLMPQERRMEDPVMRDVDVVTQTRTAETTSTSVSTSSIVETATETSGGAPLTVIDSASTTGAALPGAVAAAAADSTVVLSGTFNTAATVDLGGNKSLVGGDITVRSASGRTAVLHTSATISSSNLPITIEAPGNNTISGLTIAATHSGSSGTAINLNSTGGNYTITNNTITMTQTGGAAHGIVTDRNFNVVISGNKFTLTGGTIAAAVSLFGLGTTDVTVTGNTFNVSGATNNIAASVTNVIINTGSTGNVLTAGTCSGTSASGFIGFTNGTTCP